MRRDKKANARLRWGVERRLAFIDFRLLWEGRINRADLITAFDISTPQASTDLREYMEQAPGNAEYNKSQKCYRASNGFRPKFVSDDPSEYLNELLLMDAGRDSLVGLVPNYAALPQVYRRIDSAVLVAVLRAIREREMLQIKYQSMSQERPHGRWISPHALGHDGLRWHVRAYCYRHEEFRDFVLARMLAVTESRESDIGPDSDVGWNRTVKIRFGPHPELSELQKKVVAWDYGMQRGVAEVEVRAALVFYMLQRLNLDKESECKSPVARQIVLLNPEEIDRHRA